MELVMHWLAEHWVSIIAVILIAAFIAWRIHTYVSENPYVMIGSKPVSTDTVVLYCLAAITFCFFVLAGMTLLVKWVMNSLTIAVSGKVAGAIVVLILLAITAKWALRKFRASPSPTPTATKKAGAEKDDGGFTEISLGGGWLAFALALIVGVALWYSNSEGKEAVRQPASTATLTASQKPNYHFEPNEIPADIVLPEIAQCESGGKQFEPDGKTPTKNKSVTPPSTAFGKYQFLEEHRARAKALDFDLDTEKGQDDYATHLYNTDGGTKHWEFEGGPDCWGPIIAKKSFTRTVVAKNDAPSEPISIPKKYRMDWKSDKAFEVVNDFGDKAVFDPDKKIFEEITVSTTVRFRSLAVGDIAEVKLSLKPMN